MTTLADTVFNDNGTVLYVFDDGSGILTDADGLAMQFYNPDGSVTDAGTLETTGGVTDGFDWGGFVKQLPGAITTAQTAYNTQKLIDLNRDRAARGLAPITGSMIAPTVNFGLSPEITKMLMFGGIGLIAVMALKGGGRGKKA